MPLSPGTRLGSYEIVSAIGVYGLEKTAGGTALVMELIEGDDLSAVIARGPTPPADALPIARQMADALDAAHERSIVHRDLKPANVKVRADGTVKVLDFRLAKALEANASGATAGSLSMAPTFTTPAMTQLGTIVGTVGYMSPEQARGKPVDRRADIWAFGVVTYELLTGRQAFGGETISDVIASVLTKDPDLSHVPVPWRRLIAGCLEKDPRKRVRDIADVWLLFEPDGVLLPATSSPGGGRVLPWTVAAFAAGATAAWIALAATRLQV